MGDNPPRIVRRSGGLLRFFDRPSLLRHFNSKADHRDRSSCPFALSEKHLLADGRNDRFLLVPNRSWSWLPRAPKPRITMPNQTQPPAPLSIVVMSGGVFPAEFCRKCAKTVTGIVPGFAMERRRETANLELFPKLNQRTDRFFEVFYFRA